MTTGFPHLDEGPVRRTLPRGRHGLGRDVVVVSQRARLLEGIVAAVAARGYVAATVGDVIGHAGVSRTTFYALFADKEECFLAAYDAGERVHYERITAASDGAEGWLAKLRAGGRVYLDVLAGAPDWARATVVEVLSAGPRALERRARAHQRYAELMGRWYSLAATELGGLPERPAELFEAAVGAIHELVFGRISRGEVATLPDLEPLCLHLWLSIFGLEKAACSR